MEILTSELNLAPICHCFQTFHRQTDKPLTNRRQEPPHQSIMERVGHSYANTTLKIYYPITKTLEEVIEALDNI